MTPRVRRTARVILLTEDSRVLLFRHRDPDPLDPLKPELLEYWTVPGGGVEPGETWEQAAIREVMEETGIRVAPGPLVATRSRLLVIRGEPVEMDERYFLTQAPETTPDFRDQTAEERDYLIDCRWWSLDELQKTVEVILPAGLAGLILALISGETGGVIRLVE